MGNERIELWPCLRRINAGDGRVRGRVGGQAVNGLGWNRDETAAADHRRRLGDSSRIGGNCPRGSQKGRAVFAFHLKLFILAAGTGDLAAASRPEA
jgi:hypothetical protein